MTKSLRSLIALALVGLVAVVVAGCGSSTSSGSGSDTAGLAPASSFFYAEVTIDPSGDQEGAMRTILADLPGSSPPEQRLHDLLEKASKSEKDSPVDYTADVKPWLGDKAAVFATNAKATGTSPAWGIVVATTDEDKAKETIKKGKESGDREASYNGTDYVVDKDGDATATIDGYFVAGSEAGVKAATDAAKSDSASLSGSDRYKKAIEGASDERVALIYEDLGGLLNALASQSGESLGPAAPLIGRVFGGEPVVATVKAETQALVIDGSLFPKGSFGNIIGKSTPLLGDVPSDSWLALGMSDFGATVKSTIGLVAGFMGGQQALEQQLREQTGLDLQQDVIGWMGDVALFVDGNSKDSIGGGALIQSKDPEASQRALTKFAALAAKSGGGTVAATTAGDGKGYELRMNEVPKPIYMVQAGDKVAITYGKDAAEAALSGAGGGLTSEPGFKDAADKLGEGYAPQVYVKAPPIINLAESFGAGEDEGYKKAKPYLTILDYVIAGSAQSGDEAKSRCRIGFKPHE